MIKNLTYLLLTIMSASCVTSHSATEKRTAVGDISLNGKLFSAAYMQKAAEYKALCYQAYNFARLRLDNYLTAGNKGKNPAIITDIDETVLDNSAYAVHEGLNGREYNPQTWFEWTSRAEADTIVGACSFLKYARSRGVEIFYITNRESREKDATLFNLIKYGFPDADTNHLILREKTSSKEIRRQLVSRNHEILMLLGDNLADFSMLFDKISTKERNEGVHNNSTQFGDAFIMLPNPNYGDWESALYDYNYKLTATQKDSAIKASIRSGY